MELPFRPPVKETACQRGKSRFRGERARAARAPVHLRDWRVPKAGREKVYLSRALTYIDAHNVDAGQRPRPPAAPPNRGGLTMPNPNAFVAAVTRINQPPAGQVTAEGLRTGAGGLSVEFEQGRTARLDPQDRRSAGFGRVLEVLRRASLPAYVETDDAGVVTRLLIPVLATVAAITEEADGVSVELEVSHARHVLRRSNPDYDELLGALRRAREGRDTVAVAETEAHEIIDVRPYRRPFEPALGEARRGWWSYWFWPWNWLRWLYCLIFCCRGCVSAQRAQEMFDLCAAQTCDPTTVPPPCIPFLYPDDGCWGRAHEMCRLMIAAGASPRKVWIYRAPPALLHVDTKNNPDCFVKWTWHVAPTLCVRARRPFPFLFCRSVTRVIDPSLFTTPVSEATWKGVQNDPAAQLVPTDASIFYRSSGGSTQTDPTYAQTNQVLDTYRAALLLRSTQVGPPPYANCP